MRRKCIAALTVGVVTLIFSAAGSAARTPPHNVLLARGRTEPVVATDPNNAAIVVASANTNYSAPVGDTYPAASFASHNGGHSFVTGTAPVVRPYTSEADTTVSVARDGTVFYSYLAETPAYCSGGQAAIVVTHSIDHGLSYRSPTVVDASSDDDKPSMAVESLAHQPSHIFLSWTRWHDRSSDIWFAMSLDGGKSFAKPVRIYTSSLNNFGSTPLVGPRHHVYVFWNSYSTVPDENSATAAISFVRSSDDGARFSAKRVVGQRFQAIPSMVKPALLRVLTMPAVAAANDGSLYVAWPQLRRLYADGHVDADILLSQSHDSGRTWLPGRKVNDSGRNDRFMPAMSILKDGSLGIAFYDRRVSSSRLDVYAARIGRGSSLSVSKNVRVNTGTSSVWDIPYIAPGSTCFSPGRFFGDYIGTAAGAANRLDVVWADTQVQISGETDVWFAQVDLPAVRTTLERKRHRN